MTEYTKYDTFKYSILRKCFTNLAFTFEVYIYELWLTHETQEEVSGTITGKTRV